MRAAVPHSLGRAEARRRLHSRAHEIAGLIPGGMATATSHWPSEDRLELTVAAMGQTVTAKVDIEDAQLLCEVQLPPALAFVEPMIRSAIEAKGRKLLA